jgi:hypothetical protein
MANWYVFPRFGTFLPVLLGMLYQEKSGNPAGHIKKN